MFTWPDDAPRPTFVVIGYTVHAIIACRSVFVGLGGDDFRGVGSMCKDRSTLVCKPSNSIFSIHSEAHDYADL